MEVSAAEAEDSEAAGPAVDGNSSIMKFQEFIERIDDDAVCRAVREAEQSTSGEICVCISRRRTRNPMPLARRLFRKFKMHRTERRNGVIILIAPRSQTTAIFGDEGIHRVAGESLWDEVIEGLGRELPVDPSRALVDAVARVGRELARHFPPVTDDINELRDEIRFD